MKSKGVGSDYKYRANVQKIDVECLKWYLDQQDITIKDLSEHTTVTATTICKWMKQGEMPMYLIQEICDALALESICDMRESSDPKCAEPVTTFRYRDAEPEEGSVKMHCRIGIEFAIAKDIFELILKKALNENGTFGDLEFDDDTARLILEKGKPVWDHYVPAEWLVQDAIDAGLLDKNNMIMHEDSTVGGTVS